MRLFLVISILLGIITVSVDAQPVLPADAPLHLDALRVVILMNDDGTQTIIYDWEYSIYPPQAVMSIWLIPVPTEPTNIEILPIDALDSLSDITMKGFRSPENPCPYTGDRGYEAFDYRPVTITDAIYVGGEQILERMNDWLARGFWVDTDKLPHIQTAIEAGLGFVALTVPLYGNEEGLVSPIQLTYPTEAPTVYSLYDTSYAHVWIFADSQYAPANYQHITLDYATFRTTSDNEANIYAWNYVLARVTSSAYERTIYNLFDTHANFFITEYATLTRDLPATNDPLFTEWVGQYDYMTSLRANLGDDAVIFMPAPDMPDVERDVDLAEYVEPSVFWSCPTD